MDDGINLALKFLKRKKTIKNQFLVCTNIYELPLIDLKID